MGGKIKKIYELDFDINHYQTGVVSLNQPPYKGHFSIKGLDYKTKDIPIPDFTDLINPFNEIGKITTGRHLLSKRAWDTLEDLLRPESNLFVPIKMRGFSHTLFYSLEISTKLNALDYEKSNIVWSWIYEGIFYPEVIGNHHIFRLPERAPLYVTDTFYERVKEHKLTGFRFRLLWEG